MIKRQGFIALLLCTVSAIVVNRAAVAQPITETVVINASAPAHPFPHFWEKMFGSERAIVTLRESYRHDLRDVKQITGFKYGRFHAIFHDEYDIYDDDCHGHPQYNFPYL